MDQYAQRITRDYPVRRKAQEKENMRTYLMGQLRALGYDAKLNDCGKAVNVIAGDPERASILYAAHYDTPLREPLPAILCPTRPVTYLLYQALTPVLALVLDPGSLEGGGMLARAYDGLGFASQRSFALAVCAAVVGVIVLKSLLGLWLPPGGRPPAIICSIGAP